MFLNIHFEKYADFNRTVDVLWLKKDNSKQHLKIKRTYKFFHII